jgi:hypothetical protein
MVRYRRNRIAGGKFFFTLTLAGRHPVKHGLVKRVCDWPHSSFHLYVRRGILTLDWAGDAVVAS